MEMLSKNKRRIDFFEKVKKERKKWEVVYFLSPYCNGTCAHCWSFETFLGRFMPVEWHKKFWKQVSSDKVQEIRITGGEPFFYKKIGSLISSIRNSLGSSIPIKIFTNGRQIVSLKEDLKGVTETIERLLDFGVIRENVEIHMSADEHHAGSLFRSIHGIKRVPVNLEEIRKMNLLGISYLRRLSKNFLLSCDELRFTSKGKFKGGKLKIHTERDRCEYHRREIFDWMSEDEWSKKTIKSSGIIKSGLAQKNIGSSAKIEQNDNVSLFLLPGAEFFDFPVSNKCQKYYDPFTSSFKYIDFGRTDGCGVSIIGWWNIIEKKIYGGTAYDSLSLIGF